jgi:23S rRNA pseudouridine2605 synthase
VALPFHNSDLNETKQVKDTLLKTLVASGLGSRRTVADMIRDEEVSVNGATVTDFKYAVNTETDSITVKGKPVGIKSKSKIVLMMNKPAGVLSTTNDDRGRKTVLDILPAKYRGMGMYPAGRLDLDSTGLLLLTNDGDLTYRITHPKFEVEKEYLVYIQEKLKPEEKKLLETGPARIKIVDESPYNYSIILHEGKKREVRLMFGEIGHPVQALKRIRIGKLNLGDLPEGKIREISKAEIQNLTVSAK